MSLTSFIEQGVKEPLWRYPQTLSIFGQLDSSKVAAADAEVLAARGKLGLEKLDNLHFFRIVVVDEEPDLRGNMLRPRMFISAVFDGSAQDFLQALLKVGGERLTRIFEHCEDFPQNASPKDAAEWLQHHAEPPQTYHIGSLRDDLRFVKEEYALRLAIGKYVDEQQMAGAWEDGDVAAIQGDIRQFVSTQENLPKSQRPKTKRWVRSLEYLDLLKMLATLAVPPAILACPLPWYFGWSWWSLCWVVPAILIMMLLLVLAAARFYELTEGDLLVKPKPGHVAALVEDEDFGIQNQFTMLTLVRDSKFRRCCLRLVMWLHNGASKHLYRDGQLAGVETIHFARIHLIDNGRRMLFMSDFDGGWERYLFDFLGVGSLAVVPIWSNAHGCPKTRFLRFTTKGFAQRFIPFTRARQRRTQLWYSAIDFLTVNEIKRNAAIRAGLFGRLSKAEIKTWLKKI